VVELSGTRALDGVTLEISRGETVALLGASGSGKSTLLRAIAGLHANTSGTVALFGTVLTAGNAASLRSKMGYVVQEGGLFPHLTIEQNLLLAGRALAWSDARNHERVSELLALTRLPAGVLTRFPGELSGGQRQRVAFARGLFRSPELLLLDEPFGALDPVVRAELHEEIVPLLRNANTTTLLVTHDAAEAAVVAKRLVMLEHGKIVQDGTLAQLADAPASEYVRRFFASSRGVRDVLAETP
jgi:osmoprotectant transport system ATP-binding protein